MHPSLRTPPAPSEPDLAKVLTLPEPKASDVVVAVLRRVDGNLGLGSSAEHIKRTVESAKIDRKDLEILLAACKRGACSIKKADRSEYLASADMLQGLINNLPSLNGHINGTSHPDLEK